MKLINAEEARGLTKSNEDALAQIIEAVNDAIRRRAAMGSTHALIGYGVSTEVFCGASDDLRGTIIEGLRKAGYTIKLGPCPATIRVHWGEIEIEDA